MAPSLPNGSRFRLECNPFSGVSNLDCASGFALPQMRLYSDFLSLRRRISNMTKFSATLLAMDLMREKNRVFGKTGVWQR